MTLDQALETATQHLRNGNVAEAEWLYRQILSYAPQNSRAMHYLGVIEGQNGRLESGIDLIGRAIALEPDIAMYYSNLGELLRRAGRLEEAIAQGRRAVGISPDVFEPQNSLGLSLRDAGKLDAAIECFRRAAELRPDSPAAVQNLANALREAGKNEEAIGYFRRLAQMKLADADVCNKLGVLQAKQGQLAEAIVSFRRAVELNSGVVESNRNLGDALVQSGKAEEDRKFVQKAVELDGGFAKVLANLGVSYSLVGDHEEAMKAFRRALEIQPDFAEVQGHLANSLRETGQVEESIASYRKAVELCPELPGVRSSLIFALQTFCGDDTKKIGTEMRRFADRHEAPLRQNWPHHTNDPDPERKLRIGYVSGDFRLHPLSNCMVPLLGHHDRANVEVFCYANVLRTDDVTDRLRSLSDHWRNAWGRTDDDLFADIRADQIDILVDLSMHTGDNRLLVMARKPAPVQATFLAYPGGTGLSAIDYRLTDSYLDPPGAGETGFAERPAYLAHSYWCYDPLMEPIEAGDLPALSRGFITFASLNKFSKASAKVVELWAQILGRVAGSHLLLNAYPGSHRQKMLEQFERQGVDPARVEFVSRQSLHDYIRTYRRIDIGLDPFPFCGGITTCDALWMGVPVVTLAGNTPISRGGCSVLANAGFEQWIAHSAEEYVEIAARLAGDINALAETRRGLREKLERSSLMNGKQYAADLEAAFREMWRGWCTSRA